MATNLLSKWSRWTKHITDAWRTRQLRKPRQLNVDRLEWNTDSKVTLSFFGLIFTAFMMMLAWVMIGTPDQFAEWIANFFINANRSVGNTMSFDTMLKSFGIALILGINLTLTIFFVTVDQPETMDVLDTLEEMDDRIMARLAEVSNQEIEKLDLLIRNDTWVQPDEEGKDVSLHG